MQAFIKQRMSLDKYKINRQNNGKNDQNNRQNVDKPKRVRRTREQLIAAGYYDNKNHQNKGENKINNNQNDGDKKLKRHRRTKLEMEQARQSKVETKVKNKDTDRSHLFTSASLTIEQVSERAIQRAKERGDENWEHDFRNDYEQGQKIYYVEINELCHTKEILELYIGTVYSKVMICWVDRGESHHIGINDADKIFRDEKEAKKYYSKVRVK